MFGERLFKLFSARKVYSRLVSSSSNSANSLWARYNDLLITHPLATKCVTGGTIAVVADLVCQWLVPSENAKGKPFFETVNWQRTMNFGIIQTFFFPPIAHYWYGMLSVNIVGDTFLAAMKRVMLDQALFAPFCLSGFFSLNLLLEGQGFDKVQDKLQKDFLPTLASNYMVWVPAQLINFKFVPIPSRVLFVNLVGFFWNIYLSNAANTPVVQAANPPN